MTRHLNRLSLLTLLTILLLVGARWLSAAQQSKPFSEAEIFFELNNTDEDLGVHASIDGEPWSDLEIEGPGERKLLEIFSKGRLRTQGMTQLFFESAEPSFDELAPAAFFRRFPEGEYHIEARAHEGGTLEGTAVLSHVMASPVEGVRVNGVPAAESCAAPLPTVIEPVTIDWDAVTKSHPTVGKPGPITIRRYQFFVEREGVKLSLDLPPAITEFEIPRALTGLGKNFKFEIIARTTTGNNTAIESCFLIM